MIQNLLASFGICLGMFNGIILGRILGNACQSRALGKIQIPDIFVEILPGSGLYSIGSGAEVNRVQVVFKDNILIIDLLFHLNCKILLLEFSGEPFQPGGLLRPIGENIVFQELLGNGTCALRKITGGNIPYKCTKDTSYVNSVMFIKTLVLNSDNCVLQIKGNFFYGDRQTVGIRSRQLPELISLAVVQECRISQGRNINIIHIRSVIYNSPKSPDSYAADNHTESDQGDEQNSDKRNMSPFSHHGCTGNQRISFL